MNKHLNVVNLLKTLEEERVIVSSKSGFESILFYRGKGCKKCNNTGYKGRIGIYETLEITETVSELILKKANANDLKKEAEKQNMMTTIEDGFIKAKNGITTIEEIMRVTKE